MQEALRLETARLWQGYPREMAGLGLTALAGTMLLAGSAWSTPAVESTAKAATRPVAGLPAPPPLLVRELQVTDAIAVNRNIPVDSGPNPAAKPFKLGDVGQSTKAQALDCLTSAVYYEAGSQDSDGQKAVAQVVLNRVRHPAFPTSVCNVVFEGSTRVTGCQFTFTCDGSLARQPSRAGWERARKIAWAALTGTVYKPVGNATHYHAEYVVPYWASSLVKNAVVGAHIFYRWTGGWGRPNAFTQRYAQREPDSRALRVAAMQAEAVQAAQGIDPHELEEKKDLAVMEEIFKSNSPIQDGKRVAVRFTEVARQAVETAPREPYLEKVSASDNLRWTLGAGGARPDAQALGGKPPEAKTVEPAPATGGSAGGAADQ